MRGFQWAAFFAVALGVAVWRLRTWRTTPRLLWGFVPPLVSLALYRNGDSLAALGAWAAFAVWIDLQRNDPDLYRHAQLALLTGAALNLALLGLQAAQLDPLFRIPQAVISARLKHFGTAGLTGFVGSAADAGILLLLTMPVADAFFAARPRYRWAAHLLLATGIVITGSRLPLILALVFLTLRLPGKWRALPPLLLAVLVLAYPPLRYKTVGAVERGLLAEQAARRYTEWRVAAGLIAAQPLKPYGYGHYGAREADYRFEHGLAVGEYHGWFALAHNDYLQSAAEAGLAGLALISVALWPLGRGRRRSDISPWSLGLFAALMFVHFPVRLAPAVFALAVGAQLRERPAENGTAGRLVPLAAVLALTAALGIAAADWAAANRMWQPTPHASLWLPESRAPVALTRAEALLQTGHPDEAEVVLQALLAEQPHPVAALAAARVALGRGDARGAVATVCRAYVATGNPELSAWLRSMRAHVTNLGATDPRLDACQLE
jgi:hypothetical protein